MSEVNNIDRVKENKITVDEFIKKYNNRTSEKLREEFVKSIITNKYVEIELKDVICHNIVTETSYIKDKKGNDKLHFNSVAKYILYCLNIINLYTDINIDFKHMTDEYNALNKQGFIEIIFKNIPDSEKKEFTAILQMNEEDLMKNEYENHAFIENQIERFGILVGETFAPIIKGLTNSTEKLDEKKINAFVGKIKNALK